MASYLDHIQLSGITRIRDLMFTLQDPFRLDQGDVSFDAPETVNFQSGIVAVNGTR